MTFSEAYKADRKKILEVMELVGLAKDMNKRVRTYSTGVKQRLGLGQVLLGENDLLVLDEPMTGLDECGVNDLLRILFDQKKQGKTIIIATHALDDIEGLYDSIIRMDQGKCS